MSDELEQGGTMPQSADISTTDAVTPAAEPAEQAPAKEEKAADGKPDYSHIPKKFLKADGTPDYDGLAKSYQSLEKKLGQKGNLPPSSVDEYAFDFGENAELLGITDDKVSAFKAEALKAGFTKEQYEFMMQRYVENATAMVRSAEAVEAQLKESWGKDYDRNVGLARHAFREYAPSDADPHDPVWNHPAVMNLLARIGGEIGEDSMIGKSGASRAPDMTKEEVAQIMRSKEYMQGDRDLHAKVTAWYQKYTG